MMILPPTHAQLGLDVEFEISIWPRKMFQAYIYKRMSTPTAEAYHPLSKMLDDYAKK